MDPITPGILSGVLANALTALIADRVAGDAQDIVQLPQQLRPLLAQPAARLARSLAASQPTDRDRLAHLLVSDDVEKLIQRAFSTAVADNDEPSLDAIQADFRALYDAALGPGATTGQADSLFDALLEACDTSLDVAIDRGVLAGHEAKEALRHRRISQRLATLERNIARLLDGSSAQQATLEQLLPDNLPSLQGTDNLTARLLRMTQRDRERSLDALERKVAALTDRSRQTELELSSNIIPNSDPLLDPDSGMSNTPSESLHRRSGDTVASTPIESDSDSGPAPKPDKDLAKAISTNLKAAPALAEHLREHPELAGATELSEALTLLPPERALSAFWGAAHDCRNDHSTGCWRDDVRNNAINIFGLLLGRFVRAQQPQGSVAVHLVLPPVATEVGAEVLWLHWRKHNERPEFKRWGGRLIGVNNVLGGILLPATNWNSSAQRTHDAKTALWNAIFAGTLSAPAHFGEQQDADLRKRLEFERRSIGPKQYGTVDKEREYDPLNDAVVLAALCDDIGLRVFQIDPGAISMFSISEREFEQNVAQCWPTFEKPRS
ncbi:MAG: hypothetical protein N838_20260 [Thiohalocapsa sp. PB-PSB1]|jgi:hypothetical protein|nr:MAG: hypothetical protein N838_20260 [Thiohalocapsa sp. PB-PSB1]